MPGFRPGKVPPNLIRKMHGDSLQGEALNGAVQEGVQRLLTEKNIRPALQPQVELEEGYEPGKDAEVTVRLEALPDVPAPQIDDIALERLTVEADESAIEEQIKQLASSNKRWDDAPKKHAAANGDLVVMDYEGEGRRQGLRRRQGRGHAGRARLWPPDPWVRGAARRREGRRQRDLEVTFPADYPVADLAGSPRFSPSRSRA